MSVKPEIIKGAQFKDHRGRIAFVNGFDIKPVRRFYIIEPLSTSEVRAWQGHKKERKWFYCLSGSFEIRLIKIDDWEHPSPELKWESHILSENDSKVLFIPSGYANGFRAMEENSKLLVFSDFLLNESKKDDFRFDKTFWGPWE